MLPIICTAPVLRLGHATGGARVLIWTRFAAAACWEVGWISAQRSVLCDWTVSTKDWKYVFMQKVVRLNTWCNVACLTFQLPRITTGSFQSNRWQTTTCSLQSLQRFQRTQQTFSRMKKFCNSQVSVVTFSGGVDKSITDCFLVR